MNYFIRKTIILVLVFISIPLLSCEEDEIEEDARTGRFTLVFRNQGNACNTTTLSFTFLTTRMSDGVQESHTVPQGGFVVGSNSTYREGDVLNVKVFAASSENPLHEANIPFIYMDYSDGELQSSNNDLSISYCHEEDVGNITWSFDI